MEGFNLGSKDQDLLNERLLLIQIKDLEAKIVTSNGNRAMRDLWNVICYKVYGVYPTRLFKEGKSEKIKRFERQSLEDLIGQFRGSIRSNDRMELFTKWLELVKQAGLHPAVEKDMPFVEKEVNSDQEKQKEIETFLDEAFSKSSEFKVENQKDKYGLPEYLISSKKGLRLGMVMFSNKFEGIKEINSLDFVVFQDNISNKKFLNGTHKEDENSEKAHKEKSSSENFIFNGEKMQGKIVLTLSNLNKDKIQKFVQVAFLVLKEKEVESNLRSKAASAE